MLIIPVLAYHSISSSEWQYSVEPREFEKHIAWLAKRYQSVTLTNVANWTNLPQNPIAITFDDGYKDNLIIAQPILAKYGFTATVFVVANLSQGTGELENNYKLLTKKDIQSLIKFGWEIGSHTLTHPKLTRISSSQLTKELKQSKIELEKITHKQIRHFAYPKGAYNQAVLKAVAKEYQTGWTINPGFVRQKDNHYSLKRIEVNQSTSLPMFKLHLTRYTEIIQKIKSLV